MWRNHKRSDTDDRLTYLRSSLKHAWLDFLIPRLWSEAGDCISGRFLFDGEPAGLETTL